MRRSLIALVVLLLTLPAHGSGQVKTLSSSSEILSALDGLGVVGSVLYVAAHPDDENSALLACLVNGRHIRTAYLSVTRGEGGQNLIGAEQGEALGILRTEELLAARRIDGAEQYFTRAIDYGYSKSSEEALRLWDREKVLGDMVWVIRTFQPDVIITRFSPTIGTHGQHTASAILAREAFDAAGDSTRFTGQLTLVRPWKARRLLFNMPGFANQPFDTSLAVTLDVGTYDRLLGRSYTEIAGLSRSMHKSQGFGAAQSRGQLVNYFLPFAGDTARRDLFDGIDISWDRIPGGARIGKMIAEVRASFSSADPAASVPGLLKIYRGLDSLAAGGWVEYKKGALAEIIRASLGLWVEAVAADSEAVPGSRVPFTLTAVNRSPVAVRLAGAGEPFDAGDTLLDAPLGENRPVSVGLAAAVPVDQPASTPYWLAQAPRHDGYEIADQALVGLPETPPPLVARVRFRVAGQDVVYRLPVEYRSVDPVEGELRRPVQIVPAVSAGIDESTLVFRDTTAKKLTVRVRSMRAHSAGTVRLETPAGWAADRMEAGYRIDSAGESADVEFTIRKTAAAVTGAFRASVRDASGAEYTSGLRTLRYPHIVEQTFAPRAEGKLVALDAKVRRRSVGYIMGSGDEVPEALRQLGYTVSAVTAGELSHGDLGRYPVIVAGVRAYNTRPELRANQGRLLNYVRAGGTYVVQYCVPQAGETDNIGPLPIAVSRDRVAEEDAKVTFLEPGHPLLNDPNRISAADFEGWVQERGLSFASSWDPGYEAVLSCHDVGEPPRNGGLLFARYGKGCFIYTGYAFFRQLPAGVPGGYRLFVNLLEARGRRAKGR